jgi:ABC-type microcin C transport system permease subunit YejB
MAGAVTLPYIAVVVANAGRETILGKNAIIRETRKGISGNQKD